MLIISRVSVEFRDKKGLPIYTVTPDMLNIILPDVPERIREDPIFNMLVEDHSLEVVTREAQKKRLENEPAGDTGADGKKKTGTAARKEKEADKTEEIPAEAEKKEEKK